MTDDYVFPIPDTKLSLDYLAGFIDGEGSIYFAGENDQLIISIANTNQNIMKLIHSQYGGVFTIRQGATDNSKKSFIVRWSGIYAQELLRKIGNRLIIKSTQMDLALMYPLHFAKTRRPYTKEEDNERRSIVHITKRLNRRGIEVVTEFV